jgi:large subunit ribosomal protein L5
MPITDYVPNMEEILEKWNKNPMYKPRLAKVVVNISVGAATERLSKAMRVLEELTGQKPVPRRARKTIKNFGIRKGENIAAKVTLRKEKAVEFLKKALEAVNYRIKASSFDEMGNVSFGIREHIMIPGVKYDPEIGIFGMDIAISLERPGYRIVRRRRTRKQHIPKRHRVSREEAMVYLHKEFGVEII